MVKQNNHLGDIAENSGYGIGAVSSLTGISPDTLRVWEKRYAIVQPKRTPSGNRVYSQEDLNHLLIIKRLLEAGDAFFKNQYFNSKLHFLAERKARYDSVHNGADFKTRYHEILDEPPPSMYKEAQDYAAKMTYTNDPNVYGGILAGLARGAQSLQSSHWVRSGECPL